MLGRGFYLFGSASVGVNSGSLLHKFLAKICVKMVGVLVRV